MRLHRMVLRGSMAALLGLVLVATSLMVIAMGGEPPKRVDQRDREVLEAALKDILNPKNPLYANGQRDFLPPSRASTIVLHRLVGGEEDADVFKDQEDDFRRTRDILAVSRRNSGGSIPPEDTRSPG